MDIVPFCFSSGFNVVLPDEKNVRFVVVGYQLYLLPGTTAKIMTGVGPNVADELLSLTAVDYDLVTVPSCNLIGSANVPLAVNVDGEGTIGVAGYLMIERQEP